VTTEAHSTHVRHLVAVPQPEEAGSLFLTEDQAREESVSAVDALLADIDVTANDYTRAVLEATWLSGALWGIERVRERIEGMIP
jgi:hypothetical protein